MADNSRAQVVPGEDKCIVMASCRLYDVSSATFNEVHLSDHHLSHVLLLLAALVNS